MADDSVFAIVPLNTSVVGRSQSSVKVVARRASASAGGTDAVGVRTLSFLGSPVSSASEAIRRAIVVAVRPSAGVAGRRTDARTCLLWLQKLIMPAIMHSVNWCSQRLRRRSCGPRWVTLRPTLRSTGRAGTCLDLRRAHRRRAGYLQRWASCDVRRYTLHSPSDPVFSTQGA